MLLMRFGDHLLPCTVVVGGFFGDSGKGKVVSYLALKDKPEIAARAGVGPNAGHTVVWEGRTYKMRMLPSAFVSPETRLLLGPGVLVDPELMLREIALTGVGGRVGIDYQCAVIEPAHRAQDAGSEHLAKVIGTTGTGCGPANVDRVMRVGRVCRDVPELQSMLTDVPLEINSALDSGKDVLIEGTQGTFLSLYHGTYPFCTSKDVTASAACADVGVGPRRVDEVLAVFKSYVSRVGQGPLEGELSPEEAERRGWAEVATVTGRRRRVAPFNFELAKRAVMLNSATSLAITKLDAIDKRCAGMRRFEDLTEEARSFVRLVQEELRRPVTLLGTGPSVEEMIDLRPSHSKG
jgi:adenylosuccinate synthase